MALNAITATAVVHFRTEKNGAFKWIGKGHRRGHWRVLLVQNPNGCLAKTSRNVLGIAYAGNIGIDGVTPRSVYYIGEQYDRAVEMADYINRLLIANQVVTTLNLISEESL